MDNLSTEIIKVQNQTFSFNQKYPFQVGEREKFTAFGNKKRLVIMFREPWYVLPNGQWYTRTDASGFSISKSRVKSDGAALSQRLMRHSAEVTGVCFAVGCGVLMRVGNAHHPDGITQNWWDQDPFSLKFWNEASRRNMGEAIEVQFNLGERKIWVKNPLEIEHFISRKEKGDSDIQQLLVEWGMWAGMCDSQPQYGSYRREDAISYSGLSRQLAGEAPAEDSVVKNDMRILHVIKKVFYPGVSQVQGKAEHGEWGAQALRYVADVSDLRKRTLYKIASIGSLVEKITGRRPKTLVNAFGENLHTVLGDPASSYSYGSHKSGVIVYIDQWIKLAKDLMDAEVPMEYIVQMIPYFKTSVSRDDIDFRAFFVDIVKEFGHVKVLGWLERDPSLEANTVPADGAAALAQALEAGVYGGRSSTPLDHLVEACRILRESRDKLTKATPRQLKVFPNGVQARRYYKTAKEFHDDVSKQAGRFDELGQSIVIKWDDRWKHLHGIRAGELRLLLPRSTGTVTRWGKMQGHCISSYSRGMLPKRGAGTSMPAGYGDSSPDKERTILGGVFKGTELLYCLRIEPGQHPPIKLSRSHEALGADPDVTAREVLETRQDLDWSLEELRGKQNCNPEKLHAQLICSMLEKAGVYAEKWRGYNKLEE